MLRKASEIIRNCELRQVKTHLYLLDDTTGEIIGCCALGCLFVELVKEGIITDEQIDRCYPAEFYPIIKKYFPVVSDPTYFNFVMELNDQFGWGFYAIAMEIESKEFARGISR